MADDVASRPEPARGVTSGSRAGPAARVAVLRGLRYNPIGALGLLIVLTLLVLAIGAPLLAPFPPNADAGTPLQAPGGPYLMGTDEFGRDVLSRIIFGSRISLYVGFVSVALGVLHGAFWGAISGYFGGKVDHTIQRVMDALMAIPFLVLAITIVAILGSSTRNIIMALAIVFTPTTASRLLLKPMISTGSWGRARRTPGRPAG